MSPSIHTSLQVLLDIPGAKNVLLIDHTGDCLMHLGETKLSHAKLTVWSVLARASFGAGDEMGNRAEAGSCQEITNIHDNGGSILRLVPGGRLLVVHFTPNASVGALRFAMQAAAGDLASAFVPEKLPASVLANSNLDAGLTINTGAVLFEAYEATESEQVEASAELVDLSA